MDKEQRKKLSQEYKKRELEKNLVSEDPIIANWAKLRLGLTSDPLTIQDILKTPDEELVQLVYNKIQEFAERKYRENPKTTKSSENVISNLPTHFKQLFYTYEFEMLLENGDCNKFLDNSSLEEIQN